MKAKYLIMAMFALALSFTSVSCSDDDKDEPKPAEVTTSALTFDVEEVKVGVNETATFNITSGGGDYRIINEDAEVASATIEGNKVTVTSKKKGITGIIISDAQGNYKRVLVKSMYFNMTVDTENVVIGIKLGHTDGVADVVVTEGNGEYTATVADEAVCKVSGIVDNKVTLQAVAEGETEVTIKDMMGLTKVVKVKVETTTIPFTEAELNAIMESTENTFSWDTNKAYSWGTFAVKTSGTSQDIYWDYYGYYSMHVLYTGDLAEGTKVKGKLTSKLEWGADDTVFDNVDIEIIKNDGSRIWGVMSRLDTDYLHTGYFCVPLK